jgi:hypothetical protein
VGALDAPHLMKRFQILSNGDERSGKTPRKIFDHDSAVTVCQFEDFSTALF